MDKEQTKKEIEAEDKGYVKGLTTRNPNIKDAVEQTKKEILDKAKKEAYLEGCYKCIDTTVLENIIKNI